MTDPAPVPDGSRTPLPGELPADATVVGQVVGEPVALQVQPTFTPEQLAADRSNRKARTAAQAFPAAAGVAFVVYLLLTFANVDMNRDPDKVDPPTEQVLGAGALVTWGISTWMNRTPKDE